MNTASGKAYSANTAQHHVRANRWAAFTLVEIALVVVILAGVLATTASAYRYMLTRARVADTRALLTGLRQATRTLRQLDAAPSLRERSGRQVLDALCAHATTAEMMSNQSRHMWCCTDGAARCVDAWGTPLRFIAASATDDALRRRLQLAGGDAIFESAGPDRDFGDSAPARQTDNLRSDEPVLPSPGHDD